MSGPDTVAFLNGMNASPAPDSPVKEYVVIITSGGADATMKMNDATKQGFKLVDIMPVPTKTAPYVFILMERDAR